MHDTRGRVRIEKTPEGDGNKASSLIFPSYCSKDRENSRRRRKHFYAVRYIRKSL